MQATTNEQRFYFIKLLEHFHEKDEIDFILAQKNGLAYFGLFIILCLTTMNTEGRLVYKLGNEYIPFDIDKIRREARHFDVDTIVVALELFKRVGLMVQDENGILSIPMMSKMVGSVSGSPAALRQQRYRDRQKEHQLALTEQENKQENVTNCITESVTDNVTESVTERYEILENRDEILENRDKILDIRYQITTSENAQRSAISEETNNLFSLFLKKYPRKTIETKIRFVRAAWDEKAVGHEKEILAALDDNIRYNDSWKTEDGKYIPSAEKWLRNEEWKIVLGKPETLDQQIDDFNRKWNNHD